MNKKNGTKPAPTISTDMSGVRQAPQKAKPVNIIHHRGELNKVTFEGKTCERAQSIFMRDYGLVKCTPYDNHFILYDPSHIGWTTFCTCGAPAVITGYDVYKKDASPQGLLLLCLQHAQTGEHMPVNR